MNLRLFIAAIFSATILSAYTYAAPVPDQLIGKVTVRNSAKLDAKATRELASIANKIKKSRNKGAIIIAGDVASAKSQDDYILQAVFTARAVQRHLTSLLTEKYQIFITAAAYPGGNKSGRDSVAIHLYPHELKVMEAGLTPVQTTTHDLPEASVPVSEQPVLSDFPQPARSGMLSPPPADDERDEVSLKRERIKEYIEDPVLANELVNRAKARAAARARQLEQKK